MTPGVVVPSSSVFETCTLSELVPCHPPGRSIVRVTVSISSSVLQDVTRTMMVASRRLQGHGVAVGQAHVPAEIGGGLRSKVSSASWKFWTVNARSTVLPAASA